MTEEIHKKININIRVSEEKIYDEVYIILAERPAFGGPLASQGATPPGPPMDSMPVSWMKSVY